MIASLNHRRTVQLLIFGLVVLLTLIYWNQGSTNEPERLSLQPINFDAIKSGDPTENQQRNCLFENNESQFLPSDKLWTYHCINDQCVRKHVSHGLNNLQRVSLRTCSMVCGSPNIWPLPTVKSVLGRKAVGFVSKDISVEVKCNFEQVKILLYKTFDVFKRSVEKLEHRFTSKNRKLNCLSNSQLSFQQQNSGTKVLVVLKVVSSRDVSLTLTTDESYNLTVKSQSDKTVVTIIAPTFFGARHGLATLEQLVWFGNERDSLLIYDEVEIIDKPRFNYRGLMLDTSRHFFSVNAIKRTLDGMAFTKLNRFHWHITDSQSFPFLSKHYPELAQYGAYSSEEIYTVEDVKEVADYAKVRGIQVIPEIDAPAHAGNGWDWGLKKGLGQLSFCINQQPWSYFCGEPPCGQLNPKNNNTLKILETLYHELLQLVGPLDIFHLGGDEVNLDCWAQHFNNTDLKQLWCDFLLQTHESLNKVNKKNMEQTVVWSSGLTTLSNCLSTEKFAVQMWGASSWQETLQLLESGFNLILSHVDAWYLDCGFGSWRGAGEAACSPYRSWQNVYLHRPWTTYGTRRKQILGGEACLWTEQVGEDQLDSRLWPRAAALAERLWTDLDIQHNANSVPTDVFVRFSVLREHLVERGIRAEAIFPKYCSQNPKECI